MWLRAEAVKQIINHSAIQCPTFNLQPRCVARVLSAHYKCIFHVYPLFVSYIYIFFFLAIYADPGKFQQCQQLAIPRTAPHHPSSSSKSSHSHFPICCLFVCIRSVAGAETHPSAHYAPPASVPAPDMDPLPLPQFRWCHKTPSPLSVVRF